MYKKQSIIAIIPARGGSKGIPKKNIKHLDGLPLIAYSIQSACESRYVDRVIVSTDDKGIAKISTKYGAEIISRPSILAQDKISSEVALEHAIIEIEKAGQRIDIIVFLQATSPIREKGCIDNAIKKLTKEKADSLFSASRSFINIWGEDRKHGKLHSICSITYNYKKRTRRQVRPKQWNENGSFYILKRDILMKQHNRLGGKIIFYEMPIEYSYEIDSSLDFFLVEQILKSRKNRTNQQMF